MECKNNKQKDYGFSKDVMDAYYKLYNECYEVNDNFINDYDTF